MTGGCSSRSARNHDLRSRRDRRLSETHMKSLPSPGVTLAILVAAAVGVVTTWLLMRQPQPLVVVFEEAPGQTGSARRVDRPADNSLAKENTPRQIIRGTPSIPAPVITASRPKSENRERPAEPRQARSSEHSIPSATV